VVMSLINRLVGGRINAILRPVFSNAKLGIHSVLSVLIAALLLLLLILVVCGLQALVYLWLLSFVGLPFTFKAWVALLLIVMVF